MLFGGSIAIPLSRTISTEDRDTISEKQRFVKLEGNEESFSSIFEDYAV